MQNENISIEQFQKYYNNLNPEQKAAVDAIEGPVMTIAGAGTGKTQILAVRIAKILLETQIDPYNILCLTFTEAGVTAMRKRPR
jgi:DNA helicase-2/ATP-dependent DNA helicase PcrA